VPAPALRELQEAFWRALVRGPAAAPELLGVVQPSPALAAGERVEIYAGMYLWRLVDALREDFPQAAEALGEERFASLVRAYLAEHPSTDPSIRHLGRALSGFVAGRKVEGAPPWFVDLVRLEWLRLEVFDAPDTEPMTSAELRGVPAEYWPGLRLALVPASATLLAGWPLHRLWAPADSRPASLTPARTALRIWREGFVVYQSPMSRREETALDRLAAGAPFATVCEVFDDPAEAGETLLRWVEDGMIAGRDPRPPGRS
jgi:hypothetical protein